MTARRGKGKDDTIDAVSAARAAAEDLRDELRHFTRMKLLRTCAAWRPNTTAYRDPTVATRIAIKSLCRRVLRINDEIAELNGLIKPHVAELAPTLVAHEGIGTECAGELLVAAGENPERLHSEASFTMLCGASPIPASSGKTQRHRLNRGGNRQANYTRTCNRADGSKKTPEPAPHI